MRDLRDVLAYAVLFHHTTQSGRTGSSTGTQEKEIKHVMRDNLGAGLVADVNHKNFTKLGANYFVIEENSYLQMVLKQYSRLRIVLNAHCREKDRKMPPTEFFLNCTGMPWTSTWDF